MNKLYNWVVERKKQVYLLSEGSATDNELLGTKGSNLCEMFRLGLNVPAGFIISTEACTEFCKAEEESLSPTLVNQYTTAVHALERQTGMRFGGIHLGDQEGLIKKATEVEHTIPLLLSVRSGAPVLVKGLSETVLNLGLNEDLVELMAKLNRNVHWAYALYSQFIQMFGQVVLNIEKEKYTKVLEKAKTKRGVTDELALPACDLKLVIAEFKSFTSIPDDPWEQLRMTIQNVFSSWDSIKARDFRDVHNISENLGTAIVVQRMVYGQINSKSGMGIVKTRSGITGEKEGAHGVYYEHTIMAVSPGQYGMRSVMQMAEFRLVYPLIYDTLVHIENLLEKHYKDMQEIEFVVQNGVLYILETLTGDRTPMAAVRIAVDLVNEDLISPKEALLRVDPYMAGYFSHVVVDPNTDFSQINSQVVGKGYFHTVVKARSSANVPTYGNTVTGKAALSSKKAVEMQAMGEDCILVMNETQPADREGLEACHGVVTAHGDATATVIMEKLGKPAVTCMNNIIIDTDNHRFLGTGAHLSSSERSMDMEPVYEGDVITLEPASGFLFRGHVPTVTGCDDPNFIQLLSWASNYNRMLVVANAESVEDIYSSHVLYADGIGSFSLDCILRKKDRVNLFREILMFDESRYEGKRHACVKQLVSLNRTDVCGIFRQVAGAGFNLALLGEFNSFLPVESVHVVAEGQPSCTQQYSLAAQEMVNFIADDMELPVAEVWQHLFQAHSVEDPRHCCHGARAAVLYPEMVELQIRSIIGGALDAMRDGVPINLRIMVPQVFSEHEIDCVLPSLKTGVALAYDDYFTLYQELAQPVPFTIGAVVSTPRGCMRMDRIANHPDITAVLVDTQRLTECMFGMMEHEAQAFVPTYVRNHILPHHPLVTIDKTGVGEVLRKGLRRAKSACPDIQVGVTGRHAGDPLSILYLSHMPNVDFLCCAPNKIPVARIAAAQAHIQNTLQCLQPK